MAARCGGVLRRCSGVRGPPVEVRPLRRTAQLSDVPRPARIPLGGNEFQLHPGRVHRLTTAAARTMRRVRRLVLDMMVSSFCGEYAFDLSGPLDAAQPLALQLGTATNGLRRPERVSTEIVFHIAGQLDLTTEMRSPRLRFPSSAASLGRQARRTPRGRVRAILIS